MEAITLNKVSIEEYIALSQAQNQKYEYHDGQIFAMAGGTIEHGTIGGNIFSFLNEKPGTDGSNCRTFNSDIRLYVEKGNRIFYPDAMVVCGEIKNANKEQNSVTNPTVIIEVLSDSTESYDRGDKFHFYQSISSFREYVLVSQNKQQIDVMIRNTKNLWAFKRFEGQAATLKIESIEVDIPFNLIYRNVEFDNSASSVS